MAIFYKLIIKIVIYIILIGSIVVLTMHSCNQKKEIDRLSVNVSSSFDTVSFYKSKSQKLVSQKSSLVLKMSELEMLKNKEIDRLLNIVKDLDIKKKKVDQILTALTQTNTSGKIILHDTVIKNDTILKYKVGNYKDQWTDLKLTLINDSVNFSLKTIDTIDIVIEKKKYGKFKLINIVKKRPFVYISNGIMTRPNSTVIINNIKIKN